MAKRSLAVLLASVVLSVSAASAADAPEAAPSPKGRKDWQVRWVFLHYGNGELEKDPAIWEQMQQIVRRAAAVGYNGVVFADRDEYWYTGKLTNLWRQRLGELRQLTSSLNLKFVVHCVPAKGGGTSEMGSSVLVREAPLVVRDSVLVPVKTAAITNGSFEEFEGNTPTGFGLPEAGRTAFIDRTTTAQDGQTCIRVQNFENVRGRLAMPKQTVAVKPFQHYRVSFWLKISQDFNGTLKIMALVPGEGGNDRDIVCQEPPLGRKTPRGEWFKVVADFNSWNNDKVSLLVGPIKWGEDAKGTYWLDHVDIEDVPFLNVNRRADLPSELKGADGTVYAEGKDYARIADPRFPAVGPKSEQQGFANRQEHPVIEILPGSSIKEGQRLLYTGYHVALEGEYLSKTPSLTCDMVFDMYAEQARILRQVADPDGYLLWFDEMRTGGWEPKDLEYPTCGELINAAIMRTYEIVMREGGGKPVYTWHDMLSPSHNARPNYYLLRNTAEGAGKDLPKGLGIWVWGGGRKGADHLKFFGQQGLHQIICTYYDSPDIEQQYMQWMSEIEKAKVNVDGVVYSTWGKGKSKPGGGFADLEKFAEVWWGGGKESK
jgi:hypothetical protein